jgi:hypothetical protein
MTDSSTKKQSTNSPGGTGFQPVNPWRARDRIIQSRNLPHVQAPEATYFVTFRCRSSVALPSEARGDCPVGHRVLGR